MDELKPSWIESANRPGAAFPLNNLPYGSFSTGDRNPRCGVAIGDLILDVAGLEDAGLLSFKGTLGSGNWNAFMALGPAQWHSLRSTLTRLLAEDYDSRSAIEPHLVLSTQAVLHLPFRVSEFTDFYSGKHHATNVGTMFRGAENALPPNWLHMPIGYNGRASSVIVSGTPVRRPRGQLKEKDKQEPRFGESLRFDFELEMGAIVGQPSDGPISIDQAFENIFGYVLLNDWSARDIQAWEYQPLGPFQAKASATTISPWIVTAAALEPFRCSTPPRDTQLLPYLTETEPHLYDVALEVSLMPEGEQESKICRTNFKELYYSPAQQLAHHTSSGCPMRVGDLLGSGTISGPGRENRGSMLELTWGGRDPLVLDSGEERHFLENGDTLTLYGEAIGKNFCIGFGFCAGKLLPAINSD